MTFKSGYVALVGKPNVGKSTLLNALLGERLAIVTPKPQTTRHRITGVLNEENAQIIFLDTPGYHESSKPLNQAMLEIVDRVLGDADVVCLMVEPPKGNIQMTNDKLQTNGNEAKSTHFTSDDYTIEKHLFDRIGPDRCIVVINKVDTVKDADFEHIARGLNESWGAKEVVALSALHNIGVVALIDAIKQRLPEGPAYFPQDDYTNLTTRFLAAEIIREQVFLQMHQEIPYSAAVVIDDFREPRDDEKMTVIKASIVIEKESQKGMVIGSRGARIKAIGKRAREKIEEMVGTKVFLELAVRVEENWTKDEQKLRELGYHEED